MEAMIGGSKYQVYTILDSMLNQWLLVAVSNDSVKPLTVVIPKRKLRRNCTVYNSRLYSEFIPDLIKAGIISKTPVAYKKFGVCMYPVYKLLKKSKKVPSLSKESTVVQA